MAVKHVTLRAWSDNSDVPPQKINQGDILSRTFIITLVDSGGAPIDLTLSSVRVHFTKPDGKVCYIDASIVNASAGIFSVTLDSQCTAVPGLVKSIVQVTGPNGENMYCTGPKISVGAINVENSVVSSNEFTALTAALAQVQNIANKVDKSTTINGHSLEESFSLTSSDIGAIDNALKGVANGIATLNSGGKIEQDPASYGKAGGAALISALPESAVLVKLNPDGTLSEAAKNTDYVNMETGAFTPFLKGSTTDGSFTYHYQFGQYTKIGNMVFVQLYIKINTIQTAAKGNLILAGLPFGTGNGYARFPNIVGKIGGKDFVGVVDTTNGTVYGANCIGYVDASTLVSTDGFSCSISYRSDA